MTPALILALLSMGVGLGSIVATVRDLRKGQRAREAKKQADFEAHGKKQPLRDQFGSTHRVADGVCFTCRGDDDPSKPFDPLDPNADKDWCVACDGIKDATNFGLTRDQLHWFCKDCRDDYDDPDSVLNPRPEVVEQTKAVSDDLMDTVVARSMGVPVLSAADHILGGNNITIHAPSRWVAAWNLGDVEIVDDDTIRATRERYEKRYAELKAMEKALDARTKAAEQQIDYVRQTILRTIKGISR